MLEDAAFISSGLELKWSTYEDNEHSSSATSRGEDRRGYKVLVSMSVQLIFMLIFFGMWGILDECLDVLRVISVV